MSTRFVSVPKEAFLLLAMPEARSCCIGCIITLKSSKLQMVAYILHCQVESAASREVEEHMHSPASDLHKRV